MEKIVKWQSIFQMQLFTFFNCNFKRFFNLKSFLFILKCKIYRKLFKLKNPLKLHEKKSKQLHLENALSLEYFFIF